MADSRAEGEPEKGPGANETLKECKSQKDSHSKERRPVNREEVGTAWVLGLVLALAESSICFIWSPGMQNETKPG